MEVAPVDTCVTVPRNGVIHVAAGAGSFCLIVRGVPAWDAADFGFAGLRALPVWCENAWRSAA
jgi:hypothetical protein